MPREKTRSAHLGFWTLRAEPICQSIKGESVDKAISDLLLQTMTPMALDVALTVQQEIHTRLDEVDRMRHKQVERARYEADLAQPRYMHVDPLCVLAANVTLDLQALLNQCTSVLLDNI